MDRGDPHPRGIGLTAMHVAFPNCKKNLPFARWFPFGKDPDEHAAPRFLPSPDRSRDPYPGQSEPPENRSPLDPRQRGWPTPGNSTKPTQWQSPGFPRPDVITIGPGNFIGMVGVPLIGGISNIASPFLVSKTVITKRKWFEFLGGKQMPPSPNKGISAERSLAFCQFLSRLGPLEVGIPTWA
jgi:hypothetical protein